MRWLKPNLRSSIYGLLGASVSPSDSAMENAVEDVRETMLDLMGEAGFTKYPALTRRLRYAADIQALWYLRGDLMGALAAMHDERVAREQLASVTQMFKGLVPGSLHSRPSPLVG